MAATAATTTIQGVSLLTEGHTEPGDVFDVGLSPDGIEVRRRGRVARQMSWDQVSEWRIEKRRRGVLLTLRSRSSSIIRLVIPSWTSQDLDAVLRNVTAPTTKPDTMPEDDSAPAMAAAERADRTRAPDDTSATTSTTRAPAHTRRGLKRAGRRITWKAVGTIVLLAVLATAVTLVLLQSAGIIHWGLLGPTA